MRVERSRPVPAPPASADTRALTALSEREADRYEKVVGAVAAAVESALSPGVSAHRLRGVETAALRFVPWREERATFAVRLAAMAATSPCLLFADVRDCYRSIRPAVVEDALERLGADPPACARVRDFLDGLARRGVRGLPVGPEPSSVLANAVLATSDRALERWGIPYLRWVDDVVAGTSDRGAAERVVAGLAAALGRVGLELNTSKTRIVVDPKAEGLAVRGSMGGWPVRVG